MIDWEIYSNRLFSVRIQCDMARKTFAVFSETPEATDSFVKKELEHVQSIVSEIKSAKGEDVSKHWVFTKEGIDTYIRDQKGYLPKRLEEVSNRINQNELILVIAVFESILKDIHREVLRQNPSLLKKDRTILLGKLVEKGVDGILNEEIEREVHALDRKNVQDRAKYFDEVLDLDWGADPMINLVQRVSSKRNQILHEDPDIEVKDSDNTFAFTAGIAIPLWCIAQASILYPAGFLRPKSLDEQSILESRRSSRTKK